MVDEARDIWHDDEGVWAQTPSGRLLGPFTTEAEAEAALAEQGQSQKVD